MSYQITLDKEALQRYLSVYCSIASKEKQINLYVGKTGDNREGCNPIISRIGNHFSYNKIHSQLRNKIIDHEKWRYKFIYDHIIKYSEIESDKHSQISLINEMERWLNEEIQIISSSFNNCNMLNPLKLNLKFQTKKYQNSFQLRSFEMKLKIESTSINILQDMLTTHSRLFNPKVSLLFLLPPESFGLRGDSHLWKELKFFFKDFTIPNTKDKLKNLIFEQINKITDKDILRSGDFYLEKYSFGGMSSGQISSEFWNFKAIDYLWGKQIEYIS